MNHFYSGEDAYEQKIRSKSSSDLNFIAFGKCAFPACAMLRVFGTQLFDQWARAINDVPRLRP